MSAGADAGLIVTIGDRETVLEMTESSTSVGVAHVIPVGPRSIVEEVFERRDPPATASLTNALGIVHDHLDDVIIDDPTIGAVTMVRFRGQHTASLARVELGSVEVPPSHLAERAAIDEVFRTIVAEPPADRRHNPGLDDAYVDTIVATCCVVLAIMRRLALHDAVFDDPVVDPQVN